MNLRAAITSLMLLASVSLARAAEHITLANGFEIDCVRREPAGDKVRLYFSGAADNYTDVLATSIVKVEFVPDAPPASPTSNPAQVIQPAARSAQPTTAELKELLAHAGAQHNIDADLLASLVYAESNGRAFAVSRTGARGLMQLMPGTAASLGVKDSFAANQNVEGGTHYLDELLVRYHDNIALALAAYNAGPGAVDRYHGIPAYRETRAYVARVIREFNRRKSAPGPALLAQAK